MNETDLMHNKVMGSEFQALVRALPFGKRMPTAIYLHKEALVSHDGPILKLVLSLIRLHQIGDEFNVIKFHIDTPRITFLEYPRFFDDPHPSLAHSVLVNLVSGAARNTDYLKNPNPPILHRKETFLSPDDPRAVEFAALTAEEEAAKLYEDSTTIGFKLNWERLLKSKGITYAGHSLVVGDAPTSVAQKAITVDRHKTALTRFDFSKPIKTLFEHGLLRQGTTVFDYGCGPGSDVSGLRSMGYDAGGWDPVFRPEEPRKHAEVVNLGYVLNVVEDPVERVETLATAWELASRLLVVSALIRETVPAERALAYGDGVLTSRNTFQKYFDQHELQSYIEDVLEHTAIPVALGIFYVFREPADLQAFLVSRTRRAFSWESLGQRVDFGQPGSTRSQSVFEANKELLEDFWNCIFHFGRLPLQDEYKRYSELGEKIGSPKRALRILLNHGKEEAFRQAQGMRKADTLVYLASSNLRHRVPFKHQPSTIRADIKAFFGDYKKGLNAGLELLFASGDVDELALACEETRIGWQDDQALYVHVSLVKELPPVLRAYVSCAETLYGDAAQADIVKLHKSSGKVTFLVYDDFDSKPLPQLRYRVKVNLRSSSVQVYDHTSDEELLCLKERFLPIKHPDRSKMEAITEDLRNLGFVSSVFIGPTRSQILRAIGTNMVLAERLGLT